MQEILAQEKEIKKTLIFRKSSKIFSDKVNKIYVMIIQ